MTSYLFQEKSLTKIKTFDTEQPFIIFTVATATRILSKGLQYSDPRLTAQVGVQNTYQELML
jgi:hypothetical protein